MDTNKVLNIEGLEYFWRSIKSVFVRKEEGKGLSSNDFTDGIKDIIQKLSDGMFTGDMKDAKIINLSPGVESGDAVTLGQLTSAIQTAIYDSWEGEY